MFHLFKWTSGAQPPPPPPLPPSLLMDTRSTAQSFDLISTLVRIESKLDIILTKLDSNKPKYIVSKVSSIDNTGQLPEEPEGHSKICFDRRNENFVNELMKKVEQMKIDKHMGQSHGFMTTVSMVTDYSN